METRSLYPLLVILCFLLVWQYGQKYFRKGLRSIPGPFWARLTSLYRVSIVFKGKAVENYQNLHEKYGPVVRTGPNHVSISDPEVLPLVYSRASNFRKVSISASSVTSPIDI